MATVGSWGTTIVFATSDYSILTFSGLTRQVGSEWAAHGRLGAKDQVEFIKPSLQKITFKIELDAMHGVRPRTTLDRLAAAAESGEVNFMVVGGKMVGANRWRITSISEAWNVVYTKGELVKATVTVSMEEYI